MKKSNKKIPKTHLPKYGKGGLGMVGKDLKNTGLFLADTALAEWAPNLISQDQYSDTKYGANLGTVASVHESFDSQSPIRKNVSKMWTDDRSSGMNEEQQKAFNQVQPIAKVGSSIGEMWTTKGLSGIGQGSTNASGEFQPSQANGFAKSLGDLSQAGTKNYTPNMYDNNSQTTVGDLSNSRRASMYSNGGMNIQPNAEIESEENVVAPNGGFLQADGPTHEQGGVPVALPGNSMIFSDRLKLGKKTFAELNKVNNTSKEDKILESNKYGTTSKRTAELMKFAKNKNSEELFNAQEALKQAKVEAYAKKMGVTLPQAQEAPEEGMQFPMGGVKLPMYPYGGEGNMLSYGDDPRFYNYQGNKITAPNLKALSKDKGVSPEIGLNNYNSLLNTRTQVRDSNINVNKQLPKFEYLNDPTKGSYDEQFNAYKKVYLPGFKYGGLKLPKFLTGGRYVDGVWVEDNQPTAGFQTDAWQQSSGPVNNTGENSNVNNLITNDDYDKFRQHSLEMTNSQIVGPTDEERNIGKITDKDNISMANDGRKLAANRMSGESKYLPDNNNVHNNPNLKQTQRVTDPNSKNFDWKGLGSNVAMGLANNAGNIYNLSRYNKPEVERYERAKATLLDPSAAIRNAMEHTRRAEYNVRGASGGNAGTYLSNRVALNAQNISMVDAIRQQYANANAGISNNFAQYNNNLAMQEVLANAQNRARNRSGKGEAISQIGKNYNQQVLDNKKGNLDDSMMKMLPKLVNDPSFMKFYEEYKKNNPNG